MAASNTPRAKTERLMNLTMCLLATRRALPKARIRRMVEGYHDQSDEAFDRMFERDKGELRELGIPLVTEELDGLFEDEPGYRIDRRDYALPPIELTADERAVVGLATRMWSHAAMAPSAAAAWRKLAAESTDDDGGADPFVGIEPSLGGSEPAFAALQEAATQGRSVRFSYRSKFGHTARSVCQAASRSASTSSVGTAFDTSPWTMISISSAARRLKTHAGILGPPK